MPSKNILKIDTHQAFYHVYARGNNKQIIFLEKEDYWYFIHLFKRYLSTEVIKNKNGTPYVKLYDEIEALCYCLMPNHFHLLVYQKKQGAMSRLMRGVMTAYTMYLNTKYERRGTAFESRYKAAPITNTSYLLHISRYIHLNPKGWRNYPLSSLRNYLGAKSDWLKPEKITNLFTSPQAYIAFLEDYTEAKKMLDLLKNHLANNS